MVDIMCRSISPRCGELWMCNLSPSGENVQSGYRPVFILSNNRNNECAPIVNVIPLTTRMNKRKLPVHVEIWNYICFGLKAPSTILVEQITTINSKSLDRKIGAINDREILRMIRRAIEIQFPI